MKNSKAIIIILFVFSFIYNKAEAQMPFKVDSICVSRDVDSVQVNLRIDLNDIKIDEKELLWLTPRLINATDSIDLTTLCIYGRNPYYSYVRTGPYAQDADLQIRGKKATGTLDYVRNVAFEPWMEQAQLVLICARTNTCGDFMSESYATAYNVTPPTSFLQHRSWKTGNTRSLAQRM